MVSIAKAMFITVSSLIEREGQAIKADDFEPS